MLFNTIQAIPIDRIFQKHKYHLQPRNQLAKWQSEYAQKLLQLQFFYLNMGSNDQKKSVLQSNK